MIPMHSTHGDESLTTATQEAKIAAGFDFVSSYLQYSDQLLALLSLLLVAFQHNTTTTTPVETLH